MTEKSKQEKAQQKSFTGDKLDWMTALSADPRLDSRAFEVGFCIAQHVNQRTGLAILSDETIADKTGIPKRWVARARASLKASHWIDWKRTKTANVYWTKGDPLNAITDHQTMLKDARDERRKRLKKAKQELPPVAHLKSQELPPVAHADLPPMAERELPPMADIHLRDNTVDITPSKDKPTKEGSVVMEGRETEGDGKRDQPFPAIQHEPLAEMRLIDELGDGDTERGLAIASSIGAARFEYLRRELIRGTLLPSAVEAARMSVG